MGLTKSSVGIKAVDIGLSIEKSENEYVIALAGNPNVGKSTVFNGLTGLNQHTGNWAGKTVTNAKGVCSSKKHSYIMVDIPGTYSLMAHSTEEEVARNFICFGKPDAVVVVCDATCLERNLNLVLQTMEICNNVIVCLNLIDEAKRKGIRINKTALSQKLGVPVVSTVARKKKSLTTLLDTVDNYFDKKMIFKPLKITYNEKIENAVYMIEQILTKKGIDGVNTRWLSLRLIENNKSLIDDINKYLGIDINSDDEIKEAVNFAQTLLSNSGIDENAYKESIVSSIMSVAEDICKDTVKYDKGRYAEFDKKADKILTGRLTGYPIMLLLLMFIFWLTVSGANYPSSVLSNWLFYLQDKLHVLFDILKIPPIISSIVIDGAYRVLAWVVSVMLPPMAIFFPLFTLLEDSGYLPRIAYNLDKPFKKCSACGKQALTMCMGFGCNAAGIVGCRIIDSPRERLLAVLTNCFVPCNGRFPALIALISMFFIGTATGTFSSILSALILTLFIILGIVITFLTTKILSKTVLKGIPSSFTLELPPYRRPQIGKVIVRSVFDRTLFVLGRAAAVAAPMGVIIWLFANITVGDSSILNICADFLDPFAKLMGLDGIILMAFILGIPANEIVLPIIIMAYMSSGSLTELASISQMQNLFINNGWTVTTAVCVMIFSLFHWSCSTTLITIKKETGSLKWTVLAFFLPTIIGIVACVIFNSVISIFV
ncbi:MAG: ferrous iron transport protein B [Clostridia bacterium]|nr:ferrous iron transport protein B [Clostridia bacterium]